MDIIILYNEGLQHEKCSYCKDLLLGQDVNPISFDVEQWWHTDCLVQMKREQAGAIWLTHLNHAIWVYTMTREVIW